MYTNKQKEIIAILNTALQVRGSTVYCRLLERPGRLLVVGHGTLGRTIRNEAYGLVGQGDFNSESGKIPTAGVLQLYPPPQMR